MHATDVAADDVLSGRYDHVLPLGGPPADERWFTRLHGDDELDVWLISWVPERSTELHDHGGSLGALTVVSGALAKLVGTVTYCASAGWRQAIRLVSRSAGCTTSSGRQSRGHPSAGRYDLSVHAYSPPLTAMSYYDVTDQEHVAPQAHRTDRQAGGR